MINTVKSFYRRNHWGGRLIITFLIISFLIITMRTALSPGIIYGATSWLKKQGIEASIEAIDIDIFNGTISLRNARGIRDGKPLFNVGLVSLHWQWAPLSNKTIKITSVTLDSLSINIKQYSDTIIIGGVNLPLTTTKTDPDVTLEKDTLIDSEKKVKAWAAALGEVSFTKLNICYLQNSSTLQQASDEPAFIDYCINLDEMLWAGTISYATDLQLLKADDIPLSSTGNFTLNGLSVIDNRLDRALLTSKSNTLTNVVINGLNDIQVDLLTMNELALLQRDDQQHSDSIKFHQLTIDDIKLSHLNSLAIGDININEPGTYLVKLDSTNWEYQKWLPQSSGAVKTADNNHNKIVGDNSSSFRLNINSIAINNSDLCYLDKYTSVYYCLTFNNFSWDGTVEYDSSPLKSDTYRFLVKGNLELILPKIHNLTIDRTLLNFSKLHLTNLDINGIDNISIKDLKLDTLIALQRSKKDNDYTVSFDEFSINNFKYDSRSISFNKIELEGLSNTVSINDDGGWEHEKWLPETKTKNSEKKDAVQDAESTEESKPLNIALNNLKITTNNKITFIDNSTQPVLKIGLSSLAFDLANIHTEKPDVNSDFKLSAKTTRHGTINIEGTVKPLANKVSFDAKGKLEGFDLRAATPATKKSIGHIIQSGQMDADLKLLAVDGVLDSNIALSLYQFNIKATSKESAKKLDAKFGMPLNQTLVLLRDRDNSIHLDIPVTGDVNNPEFEPMDAIIKATSKAATVALITFYTPYGLAYAGGNIAFNIATALNFEPIKYAAGSAEITTQAKEQLTALSKLLSEKSQLHLTLCGVTNQQDLITLYPELRNNRDDNDDESAHSENTLTKEQTLQLKQLARDRQINSKNYLVNVSNIEHDRLILCAPEHKTDDDAIAGVEIII